LFARLDFDFDCDLEIEKRRILAFVRSCFSFSAWREASKVDEGKKLSRANPPRNRFRSYKLDGERRVSSSTRK
jgi:hypothetical protein